MRRQMLGGLAGLLTLAGVLAGCAAPSSLTPVPEARAAREIEGVWLGDFITAERRFEPATFTLETPAPGKITGKARLPHSEVERLPILSGTYSGNRITLKSNVGATYDLRMGTNEAGELWLEGIAAGLQVGDLKLKKL